VVVTEAPISVAGWTVRQVNQETRDVAPGATLPLCQAIPLTELVAHLRTRTPGRRVTVRLRAPGHPARDRRVVLRRSTAVAFTPHTLRLRDDAFVEGLYRLTVRHDGRTLARTTLRLARGTGSSC
jgi:hypothetical protein